MVASSADINTQMGAILGTAPRGSGTITAPGSEIDIEGGVDPLDLGSLTLGGKKKKEDQPFLKAAPFQLAPEIIDLLENANFNTNLDQQSIADNLADTVGATDTFSALNVPQDLGISVGDPINNNADNQLFDSLNLARDLDVRKQTDTEGLSPDTGTNIFTPSLGAEDRVSILKDTDIFREPTSDELRVVKTLTPPALQAAQSVAGQTEVPLSNIAKGALVNTLIGNNPIAGAAVKIPNAVDSFLRIPSGSLAGNLQKLNIIRGVGAAAVDAAKDLPAFLNDPVDYTKEKIMSTVDGIKTIVSNPGAVLEQGVNSLIYGTGDPVVTNIPLAHGSHHFTTDKNGNITTPGWITGLIAMAGRPVSTVFGAAETLGRTKGTSRKGDLLQTAKGLVQGATQGLYEDKSLAPSYIEEVSQRHADFTDAAVAGGIETNSNVAFYSSSAGDNTYINFALGPADEAMNNVLRLEDLPQDTPISKLTAEDMRNGSLFLNNFVYNFSDMDKYGTGITAREAMAQEQIVKMQEGAEGLGLSANTTPREYIQQIKDKYGEPFAELHESYQKAYGDFWGEAIPMTTGEVLKEDAKFNSKFATERAFKKMKEWVNSKEGQETTAEINSRVPTDLAMDYNYNYQGSWDRASNTIAQAVMDKTGQNMFGYYNEGQDQKILEAITEAAPKDEYGISKATDKEWVNSADGQLTIDKTIDLVLASPEGASSQDIATNVNVEVDNTLFSEEVPTESQLDPFGPGGLEERAQTDTQKVASQFAGVSMDEYGRFYNAAGERIADPDAQQALTVKAGVFGRNITVNPIDPLVDAFTGTLTDITKGIGDLLGGDKKTLAEENPLETWDSERFGRDTEGRVYEKWPADDDQEEAAAQAGGLVAQSVVDDTYGLGGLTEDADWGADATGGWW